MNDKEILKNHLVSMLDKCNVEQLRIIWHFCKAYTTSHQADNE